MYRNSIVYTWPLSSRSHNHMTKYNILFLIAIYSTIKIYTTNAKILFITNYFGDIEEFIINKYIRGELVCNKSYAYPYHYITFHFSSGTWNKYFKNWTYKTNSFKLFSDIMTELPRGNGVYSKISGSFPIIIFISQDMIDYGLTFQPSSSRTNKAETPNSFFTSDS